VNNNLVSRDPGPVQARQRCNKSSFSGLFGLPFRSATGHGTSIDYIQDHIVTEEAADAIYHQIEPCLYERLERPSGQLLLTGAVE